MRPERVRRRLGFALGGAGLLTLITAAPSLAQGLSASSHVGTVPLAIAIGAGGFALLALVLVRNMVREGRAAQRRAGEQVASLRALVDDYEALISGHRELTVVWSGKEGGPRFLGEAAAVLPAGRRPEAILDFDSWLSPVGAVALGAAVARLRQDGQAFDMLLGARDGRKVRASGWPLGGGAAMRVRPTLSQEGEAAPVQEDAAHAVLAQLREPAFVSDEEGSPAFVNAAYKALVQSRPSASPAELATAAGCDLIELDLPEGRGGYLSRRVPAPVAPPEPAGLAPLGIIIDALATPIAIFDASRALVQSNSAYAALWRLDPKWLQPGLDERVILDRLRTYGHAAGRARLPGLAGQAPAILYARRGARERAVVPARRAHGAGDFGSGRAQGRRHLCVRGHHRPAEAQEPAPHPDRRAALDAERACRRASRCSAPMAG